MIQTLWQILSALTLATGKLLLIFSTFNKSCQEKQQQNCGQSNEERDNNLDEDSNDLGDFNMREPLEGIVSPNQNAKEISPTIPSLKKHRLSGDMQV